ncbi:MAG: exodeoxyribonuclease III [Fimbriimonadaceae bacterium]|nr:exodeoxyribonuclease III [Fimbriimonadaceae bacterium]
MRIATFNVNSIRARMPRLIEWLDSAQPDIVAIQETKVEDAKFPFADLESTGYIVNIHGQPRYNGVCFLSKEPIEDIQTGFLDPEMPTDARIIRGVYRGIQIINTYVPNGTQVGIDKWDYKMRWLEKFNDFIKELGNTNEKFIWLGDINIAPTPGDVYESEKHLGGVGHHPDEFERLARIVDWGWTDCFRKFNQEPEHYTFFDFRIPMSVARNLGWRIDHIYASEALKDSVTSCWTDLEARTKERPSDHAPHLAEFDL